MYRGRIKKIHFIGIGGSGMNGIAEVLVNMGYKVTGSDLSDSDTTRRLASIGATVFIGHKAENVAGSHCVVYSSAVKKDNPEMVEAASRQIPVIPRAEMLAELMRMKYGIAIAGTHGKTTTTSMVSVILAAANIDPTVVTGGKLNSLGANAKLGGGDFLVAEADESDGSFLKLSPTIAVVTNIDREHMDHYSGMEEVKGAFLNFMNKVPFYGCAVICLDHPVIQGMVPGITRRFISFGLSSQADVHARDIRHDGMKTSFELWYYRTKAGEITLNMPGVHNVYNALAAAAVARELDIDFSHIKAGLESFTGVERRFHVRGEGNGITVVDDYGHHPVEIKAVLRAAKRGWDRRTVVVFQPHRYSRTKDLQEEFLSSFNDADKLILTEIYAAGEDKIEGVSGEALYNGIKGFGHKDVSYVPETAKIPEFLERVTAPGDMVITLGAGDVWKAGVRFVELLKKKKA
ncbi:MAG TPA: UDP-N-acetylmuramate--L-alanine ligase [Thermodesulfobacteriota bacterium]|nr:UDP-N-acetylmuramate--L-alanine ligase [Thermodesulfobacteriota bacterium]